MLLSPIESVRRVLGMRCRMQSRERCAHWQFLEQGFTHRAECFYTRCAGCGFLSLLPARAVPALRRPRVREGVPDGRSHKLEDGTVQVDKSKCIGCQFCAMACPYNVRYLNEQERVVEKCTLCEQKIAQGELPQCVSQCGGMARFFGDLDKGIESFEGAENGTERIVLGEFCKPFTDEDVHVLPNVGNNPSVRYILRDHEWQGGGE